MSTTTDRTTPAGPTPGQEGPPPPAPPWSGGGGQGPPPGQGPPTRRHRPVVTGVALIVAGGLWMLHVLGVPLRWEVLLPSALIAIGLAVLVGGRWAATAGLVTVGTVVAIVALLVTIFPTSPSVSAGDRTHAVTSMDELEERYELGAGDLTVDLRELELPAGTTSLEVRVGAGQLTVLVPAGATVVVDAEVGLGEVVAFDTRVSGVTPQRRVTEEGDPDAGTLEIEASVGLGQLEVSR
jgi:hypothetical protein